MNKELEQQAYEGLLKAIDLAGGQSALAAICGGRVRQGHISNWLKRNKKRYLPCEYVLKVVEALDGQITPQELRPDIYTQRVKLYW
jgi:DNA-binding transcriptional regulator YdaS (Cro superfamily)